MNTDTLTGKGMNPDRRRFAVAAVHVAAWLFFFLWPWLLFQGETPKFERFYVRYLIFPFLSVGVFYLNYARWIPKYFFEHRTGRFILLNLVLLLAGMAVIHFWHENVIDCIYGAPPGKRPPGGFRWFFIFQNFMNLLMVAVVALVLRLTGRWYKSEIDRQALANQRNLAELKNLKSQLHPHFLFNTLNNIYALIAIEPEKAQGAVYDLGSLLRYVLKESERERVPLKDEVAFMKNYIGLMKLRIDERTALRVELPGEEKTHNCTVPPLLFINLVENAFKHGIGAAGSGISIKLEPDIQKRLFFTCRNTVAEQPERDGQPLLQQDTGVGLANLRKRLDYIYGEDYRFDLKKENGIYTAFLAIPLEYD
ncbi:MAG: histidine kinase [Bacteroides sp.]|nr:histidine kinase [Bacteroides sp.]